MWPQALQMTRDECRGILRRLELESYSHVISVFRAQGGLSDTKAKLLEELRGIFHISQERHRAEARRVANDEQLSTIAEAISGPNTWQEWSREGRRSFPMLPRVAPQTALALIANNVASETAAENAKLPYPSETAAAVKAEEQLRAAQMGQVQVSGREIMPWETKRDGYIVTDDPFKMPDIPSASKKNLKRHTNENQTGSNSKKRIVNETSPSKSHHHQQQHQHKQYQHITANSTNAVAATANTSSNIKKLYHNHSNNRMQQQQQNQQQRNYHQQQTQKQRVSAKKSSAATTTNTGKRQTTPKSSKKAQQKLQEQQRKQQQQIQKQQQQQQQQHQQFLQQYQQSVDETAVQHSQLQTSRNVTYISNSGSPNDLQQIGDLTNESKVTQNTMPQIAASKKDITKNLSKLQLPSSIGASASSPVSTPGTPIVHSKMEKQLISTPVQKIILEDRQPPPSSSTQIMSLPQISAAATKLRAVNTTILPPVTKLTTKKLASSTIVASTIGGGGGGGGGGISSNMNVSGGSGVISTIGDFTGNNSSNIISSQPQVFNIIEGTTITTNASNAQMALSTPSHTPPAVIQLHGSGSSSNSGNGANIISASDLNALQQPSQSKVLTTKILPIVLSGASVSSGVGMGCGNATNITKIETLNNGSSAMISGGSVVPTSNAVGTTIIKNIPSGMLLQNPNSSTGGSGNGSGNSALFSTTVFRKTPIIKTGAIGINASGGVVSGSTTGKISSSFNVNTSNSGGPQIISNIKLTPAIVTTPSTTQTTAQQQQQQQQLQQQLKNVPATTIRTNVQICQSPNGKVFIQAANLDASKAKFSSSLQHKILPSTLVGNVTGMGMGLSGSNSSGSGNVSGSSVGATPPQRIAIQKVQIIPAPMSSPGTLTGSFQQQTQTQKGGTLTLSNKRNMNMIFMPTTSVRSGANTITLNKSGGITGNVQSHSSDMAKPNVVVIGATSAGIQHITQQTSLKSSTLSTSSTSSKTALPYHLDSSSGKLSTSGKIQNNQMITEDTPVDILNMPIIVDSGDGSGLPAGMNSGGAVGNNIGDTVTVLSSSSIESAINQATTTVPVLSQESTLTERKQEEQQGEGQGQGQHHSAIILGATDWEMELDQATAVAAATKAQTKKQRMSSDASGEENVINEYKRQDEENCSGGENREFSQGQGQEQEQEHEQGQEEEEEQEQDQNEQKTLQEETDTVIIDDSFEDVIVEEQEEDGEVGGENRFTYDIVSECGNNDLVVQEKNNERIKGDDTGKTPMRQYTANEEESIEVIDEEQKHQQIKVPLQTSGQDMGNKEIIDHTPNSTNAIEFEHDAGFDETIVAEIDENTAIEYIEEDQNSNGAVCEDKVKGGSTGVKMTTAVEAQSNDEMSTKAKVFKESVTVNNCLIDDVAVEATTTKIRTANDKSQSDEVQSVFVDALEEKSIESNAFVVSDSTALDSSSQDEQ